MNEQKKRKEVTVFIYSKFPEELDIERGDYLEVKKTVQSYGLKKGEIYAVGFDGRYFRLGKALVARENMIELLKNGSLVKTGEQVDLLDEEIATEFIQKVEGRRPEKVNVIIPV